MKKPYRFRSAAIVAILTAAFLATGQAYADETAELPQAESNVTAPLETTAPIADVAVTGVAKNEATDIVRPAESATISATHVLATVEGTFFEPDKDRILAQLNAIRKEAADLGYVRNYVPLKWSTELEKAAMTRAVEADLTLDHTKLTDKAWSSHIPTELRPASENLYWNGYHSSEAIGASIDGWYAEKRHYESERKGKITGETGHYKAIIDPNFTHTGLSAFSSKNQTQTGDFPYNWTTTAQLLGISHRPQNESLAGDYRFNKQTIELDPKHITSVTVTDKLALKAQESQSLSLAANVSVTDKTFKTSTATPVAVTYSAQWQSSDSSVASVSPNGLVTGHKAGTATISISLNGKNYHTTVTVTGSSKGSGVTPSAPSAPTTGLGLLGMFGGLTSSRPSTQPSSPKPTTPPVSVSPVTPTRPSVSPSALSAPTTGLGLLGMFGGLTSSRPSTQPSTPKPATPPVSVSPVTPTRPSVSPSTPSAPTTSLGFLGMLGSLIGRTSVSPKPEQPKGFSRGIDISEHQGRIDWSLLKGHVDYVIIRAGFGTVRPDLRLDEYVRGAEANGIPYGFYWYSYSLNPEVAKEEAQFFLNTIKPYQPKLPLYIDMEDADNWKAKQGAHHPANTWAGREAIIHVHAKAYQAAGYQAGVYASRSWFDQMSPALNAYEKWVAHWGVGTELYKNSSYGMHQHTSSGRLPGISTNVDMNIAFKNYVTTDKA